MLFLSAALGTLAAFATTAAITINRAPVRVVRDGRTLLSAPDRRVRAVAPDVQALIARGLAKSATFARLMVDIDNTDVIAYVEFNDRLPMGTAGRLVWAVSPSQGPRYLRIQVSPDGTPNQQVAVLAHELQHALEVAHAPDVRDVPSFARLYDRIGTSNTRGRCYDTDAAQLVGRRVLLEIAGL
jgi:hypothetical protein